MKSLWWETTPPPNYPKKGGGNIDESLQYAVTVPGIYTSSCFILSTALWDGHYFLIL